MSCSSRHLHICASWMSSMGSKKSIEFPSLVAPSVRYIFVAKERQRQIKDPREAISVHVYPLIYGMMAISFVSTLSTQFLPLYLPVHGGDYAFLGAGIACQKFGTFVGTSSTVALLQACVPLLDIALMMTTGSTIAGILFLTAFHLDLPYLTLTALLICGITFSSFSLLVMSYIQLNFSSRVYAVAMVKLQLHSFAGGLFGPFVGAFCTDVSNQITVPYTCLSVIFGMLTVTFLRIKFARASFSLPFPSRLRSDSVSAKMCTPMPLFYLVSSLLPTSSTSLFGTLMVISCVETFNWNPSSFGIILVPLMFSNLLGVCGVILTEPLIGLLNSLRVAFIFSVIGMVFELSLSAEGSFIQARLIVGLCFMSVAEATLNVVLPSILAQSVRPTVFTSTYALVQQVDGLLGIVLPPILTTLYKNSPASWSADRLATYLVVPVLLQSLSWSLFFYFGSLFNR